MKKLAILGSGDLGQLIAHHAVNDHQYEVVGFFDDYQEIGSMIMNVPVIGKFNQVNSLFVSGKFDCLMMGVGYKHMAARKSLFESLRSNIPFGNLIHSSSYVDPSAELGDGVFILPGCTVDKHVKIGNNVLLNVAAVVAHDTQIDSHTFLGPSASIAGKTHIEECCFIGINSTVIDNIHIKNNITIAGGAVVTKNLTESGLYAGIPAKHIKHSI
ncbi:MAG TPA: acetyltransferase [Bacteroidia bacterium]